jgi:hypothetical protein
VNLVHTAKIRTQVLITDHSADMWSVQRKTMGPYENVRACPET